MVHLVIDLPGPDARIARAEGVVDRLPARVAGQPLGCRAGDAGLARRPGARLAGAGLGGPLGIGRGRLGLVAGGCGGLVGWRFGRGLFPDLGVGGRSRVSLHDAMAHQPGDRVVAGRALQGEHRDGPVAADRRFGGSVGACPRWGPGHALAGPHNGRARLWRQRLVRDVTNGLSHALAIVGRSGAGTRTRRAR